MDKYVVHHPSHPETPKPITRRSPWKRSVLELTGKVSSKYRHEISSLLLESYSEIGAFAHVYHIGESNCQTHMNRMFNIANVGNQVPLRREGVTGLEFDTKGIYLASVTSSGCLTVHDFETLYCLSNGLSPCLQEDETKQLLHLNTRQQLDVVRWNTANQDEVACTSRQSNEVLIFDIGYVSSEPVEVLRKKPTVTVHGCQVPRGLTDIAFTLSDKSRLLASDIHGLINIWDRRTSNLPYLELSTNSRSNLNSIQLVENQIVFGAGKNGIIYAWDLRGGRTSCAFQSHKEASHPPLTSWKLAPLLERIPSLKAQSDILSREIHSIDLDPSSPYQLAFHLDDGWSGVLDTSNSRVTHIHCPPPAWLNGPETSINCTYLRKPSWLPTCSIYAVGSSCNNGIHLLDFHPDPNSACYVVNDELQNLSEQNNHKMQNKFIPLSEGVSICAAHPLNGTIVAGTKQSSLLMVSQRRQSFRTEDCNPNNEEAS